MGQGNINFTKELKQQGLVAGHLYTAIVVDNVDPMKIARIRARVEGLMDDIDIELLPWAVPRFNHWHGVLEVTEKCGGSGSMSIPALDTKVFIVWQSEDPHTPTYQPYTVDKKTMMGLGLEDYPDTHIIYRFLNCSIMTINTLTNEMYVYNSGDIRIRIDGESNVSVKGNTDLHISGKVLGDVYGDCTLNIRESSLRDREECGCPSGDGTGLDYPFTGTGSLTVNIEDHTVINNKESLTLNTKKSVYVNTEENLHATTEGDARIFTKGDTHVKTEGETRIQSDGDTHLWSKDVFVKCENLEARTKDLKVHADVAHVKSDSETYITCETDTHIFTGDNSYIQSGKNTHINTKDNVYITSVEAHIKSDKVFINADEELHIDSKKVFIASETLDIMVEDKVQVKGGTVLISDAQITGIISKALSVAVGEIGEPDPEQPKKADEAEEAEEAEEPDTAKEAEEAEKGPKEDGGDDGWFSKQAKIVEVKK